MDILIDGKGNNVIFKKLESIVMEYPQFIHTKMVKIDTDGYDLIILRGGLKYLETSKPVLFFEYDPYFLQQHMMMVYPFFQYCKILVIKVFLFMTISETYCYHVMYRIIKY